MPYWLGNLSVTTGTPVSVAAGGAVTGKDFALSPGGVIQGKVTDSATGNPLREFFVKVYTSEGVFAAAVRSDSFSSVTYTTPALPPGTYFVRTAAFTMPPPPFGTTSDKAARTEDHVIDQAYGGAPCPGELCKPTTGTPVVVKGPGIVAGIDFALERGRQPDPILRPGPSNQLVIAPNSGPTSGGVMVEIAGWGFDEGVTTVRIGGRLAPSIECSWTGIKVVIPPGTPGPADIVVTTARGPLVLPKGFTYVAGQR